MHASPAEVVGKGGVAWSVRGHARCVGTAQASPMIRSVWDGECDRFEASKQVTAKRGCLEGTPLDSIGVFSYCSDGQ